MGKASWGGGECGKEQGSGEEGLFHLCAAYSATALLLLRGAHHMSKTVKFSGWEPHGVHPAA